MERGSNRFSALSVAQKYRLPSILLAALLTVLSLTALARIPFGEEMPIITVAEEDGVYDLTTVTDVSRSVIQLPPSKIYYPNAYLMPNEINSAMGVDVSRYNEISAEYLSQRFALLLPEDGTYHITFHLSGRHAMRAYVNGEFAGQTGKLGKNKGDTEVWENNLTISATPKSGKIELLLHSAQFYHAKRGATLAEVRISKAETDLFQAGRMKGLLAMGVLLCAGALLFAMYLMLSPTKATLYFAVACAVMALRECLQSQAWIYFPLKGNFSFMLEYFSVVLLTIFLTMYLGQYAKGNSLKRLKRISIFGSVVYGVCILCTDSLFYTDVLGYYQIFLVVCIVPGLGGLFYQMRIPNQEQAAALYGMAVFFLAAVSDIVMYSDIFGETVNLPISEIAMLVFVLAQAVSLFLMNNRVLTQAKEAEQRLVAEKGALEALDRMKTEFLGNVSHELKTPLTVMSGYAQTTKQLVVQFSEPQAEEVSNRMTLISAEAERLSLMVGQILDVSCMEEGRMMMEPVCCHLDEIIHTAVKTHYPMLNKNQNRLKIQITQGLPDVFADTARISQVIVNLISNAVRFTSDGIITISAVQEREYLLVCVGDTGRGIATERIPHIFERYSKKEKSGGGQDTGTGLGLYICKHIIEQHGGSIWLESTVGVGTSVFFTLPVAISTAPC